MHSPITQEILSGGAPERPALSDPRGRLAFRELRALIEASALALRERGVRPGEAVALQTPSSVEFATAFHGILGAGATVVPLNPLLTEEETRRAMQRTGARLRIDAPTARALHAGASRPLSPSPATEDPEATAVLALSSGTTAEPKPVMLSHRALSANIRQTVAALRGNGLDPGWSVLAPLPLSHIYGLNVLLHSSLANGNHVVLMPRFTPRAFARLHAEHHIGWSYVAPPIVAALDSENYSADYVAEDFRHTRVMLSGAADLRPDLARRVGERLGVEIIQGYGMTEASPVTHMMRRGDPLGIGRPVDGTETRIVGGELWVRGPQLCSGYLGAPGPLVEGWLPTGDLVAPTPDGGLRVTGRTKEIIKYRGYQVSPAELEEVIAACPGVRDVAVTRGTLRGEEVPHAFVVGTAAPAEVREWVARRVAPYKKVRRVTVVESIPRAATGKILRRRLHGRAGDADE